MLSSLQRTTEKLFQFSFERYQLENNCLLQDPISCNKLLKVLMKFLNINSAHKIPVLPQKCYTTKGKMKKTSFTHIFSRISVPVAQIKTNRHQNNL